MGDTLDSFVQLPLTLRFSTTLKLFTHHQPLSHHENGLPVVALHLPHGFQLLIQPIATWEDDLFATSPLESMGSKRAHTADSGSQLDEESMTDASRFLRSSSMELVFSWATDQCLHDVRQDLMDCIQQVKAVHLIEIDSYNPMILHASKTVNNHELLEQGVSC
jgi:hypothetical protein